MRTVITKKQALDAFGGKLTTLAGELGISVGAISQWDDGPIPQAQALRLRYEIAPEIFDKRRYTRKR